MKIDNDMRWTRNVARWRAIAPKCGNLVLFLPRVGEQRGGPVSEVLAITAKDAVSHYRWSYDLELGIRTK